MKKADKKFKHVDTSLKGRLERSGFVESGNTFTRDGQNVVFKDGMAIFYTDGKEVIKTTDMNYRGVALVKFIQ